MCVIADQPWRVASAKSCFDETPKAMAGARSKMLWPASAGNKPEIGGGMKSLRENTMSPTSNQRRCTAIIVRSARNQPSARHIVVAVRNEKPRNRVEADSDAKSIHHQVLNAARAEILTRRLFAHRMWSAKMRNERARKPFACHVMAVCALRLAAKAKSVRRGADQIYRRRRRRPVACMPCWPHQRNPGEMSRSVWRRKRYYSSLSAREINNNMIMAKITE